MNEYKPASRPAALGAAAVALAAMTIALGLVLPARIDTSTDVRATATPRAASAPAAEIVVAPIRVEVVAVRDATLAPVQAHTSAPKRKHGSGSAAGRALAAPQRIGYRDAGTPAPRPPTASGTVAAAS